MAFGGVVEVVAWQLTTRRVRTLASGMCCEHVRNDGWSGVHSVDMCEGVWNDVCVNGLVCPFSRRNRVLRLHRTTSSDEP